MNGYFDAVEIERLPPGTGRTVEHGGHRYAVFNVGGEYYAIDDGCPHREGPLGFGYLDGCRVHCPLHGWAYDVTTGAGVTRPDRPVKAYPTRVENGRVWIRNVTDETGGKTG